MAKRIQVREAADLLGVSPRMVQKLFTTKAIPAAKVGSIWTTTVAAVNDYLNRPDDAAGPQIHLMPRTSTSVAARTMRASRARQNDDAARYEQRFGVTTSSEVKSSSKKPSSSGQR